MKKIGKMLISESFVKKIAMVLLIILLFNFLAPQASAAADGGFGVLFDPLRYLLIGAGDAVIGLLQRLFLGIDYFMSYYEEPSLGAQILSILLAVAAVATFIASVILTAGASLVMGVVALVAAGGAVVTWFAGTTKFDVPFIFYSPQEIFSGQIPAFDVNFINPKETFTIKIFGIEDELKLDKESSAKTLQGVISSWYIAIRNFAIIGLLSVLIYIGIRILTSSVSKDKAKYKSMIVDWLVALCLLFILQYIMSFALSITELLVNSMANENRFIGVEMDLGEDTREVDITIGDKTASFTLGEEDSLYATNFIGYARLEAQSTDRGRGFGFTLIYTALVIYTAMFTIYYLKRLLKIAFLTLIAPVITLTYPIDKVRDGQAQAFNTWAKEYVFNVLIQPVHLLIYTVLVSTAFELAAENMIYAIVALSFILGAETLIKSFFGFSKANSMGGIKGFAAGSMVTSLLSKALPKPRDKDKDAPTATKKKPKMVSSSGSSGGSGGSSGTRGPVPIGTGSYSNRSQRGGETRGNGQGGNNPQIGSGSRGNTPPQGGNDSGGSQPDTADGADYTNSAEWEDSTISSASDYLTPEAGPEIQQDNNTNDYLDSNASDSSYNDYDYDDLMPDDFDQDTFLQDSNIDDYGTSGRDNGRNIRGVLRGVGRAGLGALGDIGKGAGKVVLRSAGGALLGTVAAAATMPFAIASEDPEAILKMPAAAAATGFGLGYKGTDNVVHSARNMTNKAQSRARISSTTRSRQEREFIRKHQNDYVENGEIDSDKLKKAAHYSSKFKDAEDVKAAVKYRESGITNDDDIKTAIDLEKKLNINRTAMISSVKRVTQQRFDKKEYVEDLVGRHISRKKAVEDADRLTQIRNELMQGRSGRHKNF